MAKAKRDPRTGRYVRTNRATTKRATTSRKRATRKAAPRRRTYRRNPAPPNVVKMFTEGTVTAAQVLVGKAAARSIPDLLGFSRTGTTGLAIQAVAAVASGYVASMFLGQRAGAAILAGGLTAPLETIAVDQNIPWIGEALAPTGMSGYVRRIAPPSTLGAYRRKGMAGYVPTQPMGVGAYA